MNEDKAARYHRLRRRLRVAGGLAGAAGLAALWSTGAAGALERVAERVVDLVVPGASAPWAVVLVYLLIMVVLAEVFTFPLAVYHGYVLEQRFGLSKEPFRRWVASHAKGVLVGASLATVAGLVVYGFLAWSPRWWWAWSGLVFAGAGVVLAFVAPVVLFPWFFSFRPLDRASLVARLVRLAERAGTRVLGVYEWKLSDRTRAANAALVGLGRTRRILVSDTLLEAYSDEEIEVILAHELAHHVHGDLWKVLLADAALTLGALFSGHLVLSWAVSTGRLQAMAAVSGLPLLLLGAWAWSVATLPLVNALSRRHERRADRFALGLTGNADAFVSALRRLGSQNLADERPSRLTEWLFHSHPPLGERIDMAKAWALEHKARS